MLGNIKFLWHPKKLIKNETIIRGYWKMIIIIKYPFVAFCLFKFQTIKYFLGKIKLQM